MSSLAWYPFYPGDYACDTQDLSCLEHGCYRLLLDAFWSRGPLPDDLNRLSRLAAGCDAQTVRFILENYWTKSEAGWINPRLEKIRIETTEKHYRRVNAGAAGGRAKASNARAMLEQCSTNQNQNQNQEERKTRAKPASVIWDTPPADVDPEAWAAFVEVRKQKKATQTERAHKMLLAELEKIATATGESKTEIVSRSALNAWKSVFPRGNGAAQAPTHHPDHRKPIWQINAEG